MISNRSYLLRALNEWILDNNMTPYLLVDAEADGIEVPVKLVKDGKIILNISAAAVKTLEISNQLIDFEARFGGNPFHIHIPIDAVLAIYAKENGRGMIFPAQEGDDTPDSDPVKQDNKSHLKIVK